MTRPRRWLAVALVVSAGYLGWYLDRGWYPHDEGVLGQTAERVLQGEVPHRDFDEPYTGLLTYLHALTFKLGGIRLPLLRVPLFLATLLGLAAFFRIAIRLVEAPAAAGLTLLALTWSVPNYPASMPSWYNLFFALAGTLALVRWDEAGGARWLFLAGLAGGLSFLIKLSGLFYVAGALLFLVYATRNASDPRPDGSAGALTTRLLITLALAGLVMMLWAAVAPYHLPRVLIHFVAPGSALALALAVREWRLPPEGARRRLGALIRAGAPFVAGGATPVVLFALWFAVQGGFGELVAGVFLVPFRRLAFADMMPPAPFWILAAVPLGVLLRPRENWKAPWWNRMGLIVAGGLGMMLVLAARESFPHRMVWQSVRTLVPIVGVITAAGLAWPRLARYREPKSERRIVLLVAVSVMASLVQFPYSSPIYFLYVAPLLILAVTALVQGIGRTPPVLCAVGGAFYLAFGAGLVVPGAVRGLGFRYETPHSTVRLALPRGGLRVIPEDAETYSRLIPQLQRWAGDRPIWAGPDAPELYFLGGFRNSTRTLFDFLGPAGATDSLPDQLERNQIRVIAINHRPRFSPQLPEALVLELRRQFPEGETLGTFELRRRR